MASQQKFITSHAFRVKRAEKIRKESPEKISIFDREAYVEFFLLEDIVRLYEHRLEVENKKKVDTRAGQMAKERNVRTFTAIIGVFKSAIEIAWSEITSGNYKSVWKNIPERPLMMAANSLKYLDNLKKLSVEMLKGLSDEALEAARQAASLDESLDDIESHEDNVRRITGLPSAAEIDAVIRAVEVAIPSADGTVKSKLNPNVN